MATSSEKIQKDNKSRLLGEKLYTDSDWVYHTVYGSDTFNTSSTSYVDVTNMSQDFFLEKAGPILFIATAIVTTLSDATFGILSIDLDGDTLEPPINGAYGSLYPLTGCTHVVDDVSAGSHTAKLKFKASAANNVATTQTRLSIIRLSE